MAAIEMVQTFIEYHVAMTRRVWDSINRLTEEQFVEDDSYSRGSLRNLMVHLSHTDLRWLTGLKNLPDVGPSLKQYDAYPNRVSVRQYWESVAAQLTEYVRGLDETTLHENPTSIPGPRWEVLLHLVNHGTDHRSTMLQKLQQYGAPTFDQDFILWIAARAG